MGNNKPDDEKTDLFLSLLSLSWRWHARRARSHGNSTWCTLCVTRHRKGCVAALFHSKQRKHPYQDCYQKITYWKLLHSCSEKLVRYVFQSLVRWIPSVLHWTIFWSYNSVQWKPHEHTITPIQTKMAFNTLRQGSSALSQCTHLLVEWTFLSFYFLHSVKYRFRGEKKSKKIKQKAKNPSLCTYLPILHNQQQL